MSDRHQVYGRERLHRTSVSFFPWISLSLMKRKKSTRRGLPRQRIRLGVIPTPILMLIGATLGAFLTKEIRTSRNCHRYLVINICAAIGYWIGIHFPEG